MPEVGGLEAALRAEQAAVDRAYARLEDMKQSALDVVRHHRQLGEVRAGQARVEWESLLALTDQRLHNLDLGEHALCFGRIDRDEGDSFQVGRLSVLDEDGDPLVIDWRAPAAAPFYRATARDPMGLVRRRHLLTRGRQVLGIDDEVFDLDRADAEGLEVIGEGALMAALNRSRTGRMADIVGTIQSEQDYVIRAPLAGVLVVQGGPGTGKTAVALHRAAYLLFTNRSRLEDSGVLVIGPNRVFLRYIEHVLPSLGESGVELTTIDRLYGRRLATGADDPAAERVKGDARMATVIERAVRQRERSLPADLVVPYGSRYIRVPKSELDDLVERVRRRRGAHNLRRPIFARGLRQRLWRHYRVHLERRLAAGAADEPRSRVLEREEERFAGAIAAVPEVRTALERMWPELTPEQLLHDLFGAPALLREACRGVLSDDERSALGRRRSESVERVAWTTADLALLDEAAPLLGPTRRQTDSGRRRGLHQGARWAIEETVEDITLQTGELDPTMREQLVRRLADAEAAALAGEAEDGELRVFGHVIVDEAQDLSPMQWRMVARRCPAGSMTIVGDLGQAIRVGAAGSWERAIEHLPSRHEPRVMELTVNYRTPSEIMAVADAVLAYAAPRLRSPRSVRRAGAEPRWVAAEPARLAAQTREATLALLDELDDAKVAVLAPSELILELRAELDTDPRTAPGRGRDPLDAPVVLFSAADAKGLEFDAVVLVEPALVVGEGPNGHHRLYVTLTRATQRLTVVHARPLPAPLTLFAGGAGRPADRLTG